VDSLKDSIIVNKYFDQYPLHTQKASTRYTHWKQVLEWQWKQVLEWQWKQVLEWQFQGPNVVYANLSTIREFQRINSL